MRRGTVSIGGPLANGTVFVRVIPGADHFFEQQLDALREAVGVAVGG